MERLEDQAPEFKILEPLPKKGGPGGQPDPVPC